MDAIIKAQKIILNTFLLQKTKQLIQRENTFSIMKNFHFGQNFSKPMQVYILLFGYGTENTCHTILQGNVCNLDHWSDRAHSREQPESTVMNKSLIQPLI